ncbi:MAG: RNA polymerase sigma factor [Acidimicrobiales bacterium]
MDDDAELLDQLRAGDEIAYSQMVERYHTRLVRFARSFVASEAVAQEVAQETWIAVLRGIERFESRSSLQTWLFRICANRARSIGVREQRVTATGPSEAAVSADRFDATGSWASPIVHWAEAVDEKLDAFALADRVRRAIVELPDSQRQVVTLRDAEGLSSSEVCEVLGISEANQRVLLHRGRSRVRSALERELAGGSSCGY